MYSKILITKVNPELTPEATADHGPPLMIKGLILDLKTTTVL